MQTLRRAVKAARLDLPTRAKALEAGWWQKHDGTFIALRRMEGAHLVNALLQELEQSAGRPYVAAQVAIERSLATEIKRRGLQSYAESVASDRIGGVT